MTAAQLILLDRDGFAEVIFTSWVQKTTTIPVRLGKLHILNYQGTPLHEIELPNPKSSSRYTNGALPAPTIANIDSDADLEIVVNRDNKIGMEEVIYILKSTSDPFPAFTFFGFSIHGVLKLPVNLRLSLQDNSFKR